MATVKIHPNSRKNTEILGKVVMGVGVYHNTKQSAEAHQEFHKQPQQSTRYLKEGERIIPEPPKTHICTWCSACICAILTIFLILVGIIVLIVYLLFHPKFPHFDIMEAHLNHISLDPTYLMNAEVVVLAKLTNPNEKVDVEYEYLNFKLYFRSDLVANTLVQPFAQRRKDWELTAIDLISSDVELKALNAQILANEYKQNRIAYQLFGTLRTKARLGAITHVPYWLYADCLVTFAAPPNGTLVEHSCRTHH